MLKYTDNNGKQFLIETYTGYIETVVLDLIAIEYMPGPKLVPQLILIVQQAAYIRNAHLIHCGIPRAALKFHYIEIDLKFQIFVLLYIE